MWVPAQEVLHLNQCLGSDAGLAQLKEPQQSVQQPCHILHLRGDSSGAQVHACASIRKGFAYVVISQQCTAHILAGEKHAHSGEAFCMQVHAQ